MSSGAWSLAGLLRVAGLPPFRAIDELLPRHWRAMEGNRAAECGTMRTSPLPFTPPVGQEIRELGQRIRPILAQAAPAERARNQGLHSGVAKR